MREVLVREQYRLGHGAYGGNYAFWTHLLHKVFDPDHVLWVYIWALAFHIWGLLKKAPTPSRRADSTIAFSDRSTVTTRIILVPAPTAKPLKMPSKNDVYHVMTAAIRKLQEELKRTPHKLLRVTAELKCTSEEMYPLSFSVRESLKQEKEAGLVDNVADPVIIILSANPRKKAGSVSKAHTKKPRKNTSRRRGIG
jgi:hypothetical protein